MKLSKVSWLFLIIGVFVIAIVALGAVRSRQIVEQRQLNQELFSAQTKLNGLQIEQLTVKKTALEKQLNDTRAQSKTDRELLSQPIDSLEIGNTLFRLATTYGVQVAEVTSAGTSAVNLEGVKGMALSINTKVRGDVTPLVRFISQLNNELKTGVVKQADITIPAAAGEKPTANIQLAIYTYQES